MRGTLHRICAGAAISAILIASGSTLQASADILPNPTLTSGIALANIAISVSDLDRSTKFYQALGFETGDVHLTPPALVAKTLGAPLTGKLDIRFVKRDGMIIEFVHFVPTITAPASTGVLGRLGLASLAFRVDDINRVAAIIKENGGKILQGTRAQVGEGAQAMAFLFCTDPDGVRLELVGPAKAK